MRVERRRQPLRIVVAASLLAAAVIPASCTFFKKPFLDRELSGPVTLTQQWLELTPAEPLRVERGIQEVTLFPDPSARMTDGADAGGFVSAGGTPVHIGVELVDSGGNVYAPSGLGSNMTGNLEVTSLSLRFKNLPGNVTYKAVRIRSNTTLPVKEILWRCYNFADVYE